jgi:hypothetical protein
VSFANITLCVASQRVFIFVVYFFIDSVRKLLNIPSYIHLEKKTQVYTLHVLFVQNAFRTDDAFQVKYAWRTKMSALKFKYSNISEILLVCHLCSCFIYHL